MSRSKGFGWFEFFVGTIYTHKLVRTRYILAGWGLSAPAGT